MTEHKDKAERNNGAMVMRPGPGWKQLKGPVWEHSSGVRIHVAGYVLLGENVFLSLYEFGGASTIGQKLVKANGGNRKRGLMAWALTLCKEEKMKTKCTYCGTESNNQTQGDGCHACLQGTMQR